MVEAGNPSSDNQPFSILVDRLSGSLLLASAAEVENIIGKVLRHIGEHYGADRVVLRWMSDDRSTIRATHWWTRESKIEIRDVALDEVPWATSRIMRGDSVRICKLAELPETAAAERRTLKKAGINAALIVALVVENELHGALVLSRHDEYDWPDSTFTEARLLANMIASAYWRARNQAKLRSNEARYRAILRDQMELIIRWLRDGTATWVNDRCCSYMQQPRESLIGYSIFSHIVEADRRIVLDMLGSLTPDSPSQTHEHRAMLPDGSIAWNEWTNRGVFNKQGELLEIQSVGRDITDRKLALEALVESESRFRDLIENTADWIWEADLELNNLYSNQQLEAILGHTTQDVKTMVPGDLMHPEDLATLKERLPLLIAERQGWNKSVFRYRHKDGSYRYTESTARPIFDSDGEMCGFRGVDRDITKSRTANEVQARQIDFQRRLAELLSRVASIVPAEADPVMTQSLKSIGQAYDVSRVSLWWFSDDLTTVSRTHRWDNSAHKLGVSSDRLTLEDSPWVSELLLAGKKVVVHDRDELPASVEADKELFRIQNYRSFLAVPLKVDGSLLGACAIAATEHRFWSDNVIDEIQILSTALAAAKSRLRAAAEIERRANFQSRLASVSTSLLITAPEDAERQIRKSLQMIGEEYGIDGISIWWISDQPQLFERSHGWLRDSAVSDKAPAQLTPADMPWAAAKALRGQQLQINDIADMPAAAEHDQSLARQLGYSALLCVPIHTDDADRGYCVFTAVKPYSWSVETVQELQLLANTVAIACARLNAAAAVLSREQDLVRSQRVARLGSFTAKVEYSAPDMPQVMRIELSDQAADIYDVKSGSATVEELLSKLHPDDRQRVANSWRVTLSNGDDHKIDYRILRDDGATVYVESRAEIDRDNNGRAVAAFETYKDVTDWVEANNRLAEALATIKRLKDQLQQENLYLREEVRAAQRFDSIIGESPILKNVLIAVEKVAPTDITVLVTGETGTGKELIAQAIHDLSSRSEMPMISVNCAALSTDLIESELFGHEKGAFTGAHTRRKGRFELADGGTLFLDEIGELSGDLQAKLLRVLQDGQFERLGGTVTLHADVRLIAATNRNLKRAVDNGQFRADLYYRINSFPLEMPSLSEREDDIPLLAEHFVNKHAQSIGKKISSISGRTIRYLRTRDWPGNVRELEGYVQRALISSNGPVLDYVEQTRTSDSRSFQPPVVTATKLHVAEKNNIVEVLERTNWVIEGKHGAAEWLGIPPSSLRSKMKRLGIQRPVV